MDSRSGKSYLGSIALVVSLVALTFAVFGVSYHRQVTEVKRTVAEDDSNRFTSLIGLNNPQVRNSLDPRYTDADGDLVADPPADPSKQIDPPTLTFSYVAAGEDAQFKAAFADLMAALSEATGKPVQYTPYTSVAEELRAVRGGRLTIAGLATGAVPLGVCTAGFVPLCVAADADGTAAYQMKVIVPADSAIAKLSDLRGHDLTLTEPNSNSGFKAPLVILRENGMVPPRDYNIRYSDGHVQSIEGVKDRSYEAAAVAGDVLAREEKAGRIGPGDYKVIYTSDASFPPAAIGCPNTLKPQLTAKIRDTLLHFNWKGTGLEKLFAGEGKAKFIPADYKKGWEYVRRIDESVGYSYTLPEPAGVPAANPTHRPTTAPAAVGAAM